jgi:hypothetical protein
VSTFRLVVEKGQSKGEFLRLKANGDIVAGREAGNALSLRDPQASRKHFRIEARLGEYKLQDLGSSNGTFVNGARVESAILSPGDRVAVGDTLIFFLRETDEGSSERRGPLTGREVGGYRIGRVLGRGGMGTVYEAIQISLERTVALKVLSADLHQSPDFIQRFVSEARAAGRLNHANIVSVFDVGSNEDLYFFSMEYMSGGSLDDLLRVEGPLSVEDTIPLLFDAARGLEYAQKQGLVHRDIKPDNLMLSADGVVKICDLGLAIFTARQHEVSGSPHYIAPEQALGQEIDHRADLYALGVTWYELLCGKTPFEGRSASEIARKHVEQAPPPLAERVPGLAADVVALVERLMEKDPAKRLDSPRQLQADLAELARRHTIQETVRLRIDAVAPNLAPSEALAEFAPAPMTSSPRGRQALLALAAVLLFVVVTFGAFSLVRGVQTDAANELAECVQAVESVEALLEKDPAVAEAKARDLAESLRAHGYEELAQRAEAVVTKVAQGRDKATQGERNETAARKLKAAKNLFLQQGAAAPSDPAVRARLEEILRLIGLVIEGHPKSPAAQEAGPLREQVLTALDVNVKAARELSRKQRAARKALKLVDTRCRELLGRRAKGCYADARSAVQHYLDAHGEAEPRGGKALLEFVRGMTQRGVTSAINRSRLLTGRKAWTEAREALEVVAPPLGFPKLDALVREALADVNSTRRQHEQAAADKLLDQAKARLRQALNEVRPYVTKRQYQRAASRLRGALTTLEIQRVSTVKEAGAQRVKRLEGAQRALARLVAHVKAKAKPRLTLKLELPGGERKRAHASAYELADRTFVFQFTAQILRNVRLEDMTPAQLLELCEPTGADPPQLLELACLAYELRQGPVAEAYLKRIQTQTPNLQREVDDLRALRGSE